VVRPRRRRRRLPQAGSAPAMGCRTWPMRPLYAAARRWEWSGWRMSVTPCAAATAG